MAHADRAALGRVAAAVRTQVVDLERVVAEMRAALHRWGVERQDLLTTYWVGGLIHTFYTSLEKAFSEVSPELNGLTRPPESWHRDLLRAMTLDLPDLRPPVIRPSLENPLWELLRFRHLYRNLYMFNLEWSRVRLLAEKAVALWPDVRDDLDSFAAALEAMARA